MTEMRTEEQSRTTAPFRTTAASVNIIAKLNLQFLLLSLSWTMLEDHLLKTGYIYFSTEKQAITGIE